MTSTLCHLKVLREVKLNTAEWFTWNSNSA